MSAVSIPFEAVDTLLREVAERDILPHYRCLMKSEIVEKSPGDLVTIADQAAERRLADRLPGLLEGSVVVGEEMVYTDERVLERLAGNAPVWVVDPLDGTGNFAAGTPAFAIMVSLIQRGKTLAGWIFDPLGDRMAVAARGAGCRLNGTRVSVEPAPSAPAEMRGGLAVKFLPDALRGEVVAAANQFARTWTTMCAGHEYLSLLTGEKHFKLYYRTLPWDHAAGVLIYLEAGGCIRRLDGSAYCPVDDRKGILGATDPDTWRRVQGLLVPSINVVCNQ